MSPSAIANVELSDFTAVRWVTLQLLWSCDLRCIMCDHPYKPRSEMAVETVHSVLDQLTHKVRLTFIGGEPCLWLMKRQDVMRRALREGHIVHMITNGMLLAHMTDFVDAFRDRPVSIQFSIDGFGDSYERIRQRASWQTLTDSIRLVHSRRKAGGNTQAGITVNTVLMRSNLRELPDLVSFCAQEGVDNINLTYAIIYDSMVKRGHITESESVYFCKEETDRAVTAAIEMARRVGIGLHAPAPLGNLGVGPTTVPARRGGPSMAGTSPVPNNGDVPCYRPWREIWVNQDGTVQPCCCGGIGPTIGHVSEGLSKIWNSRKMRDVRAALAQQEFHADCRCGANMFGVYRRSGPEHFLTRVREEKRRLELTMHGS
jgi:MoaA/NifB/PqqE/SkfB family radical SAM enzyme